MYRRLAARYRSALTPFRKLPRPRSLTQHHSSSPLSRDHHISWPTGSQPRLAMVSLPLFKIAALFVRHISKYGANHIKHQAHEHPRFRAFAAKYGQVIHQINMRLSVATMRNAEAVQKAKEKAETPTVKTEDQVRREEELKAKYGTTPRESHPTKEPPKSIWRRKFRALPEAKAVDLFADVIGDAFILAIATGLVTYEYWRTSQKPDKNKEMIKELEKQVEELKQRGEEFEEAEKKQRERVRLIEEALRAFKDPKTKQPLLATPAA
ncbi:optic atrophy 3 protein-domain-containing protein [Triangularia setosa]|uniref:Optic atrophy 3 protein-domain-containing protein n=1 Tax=Triangularia setosa TaxID=2587417 RepID=A0AAN7AAQ6_9PEZI|nr:optic atrophy 3 protein-domain-containing protein [Podospora setosa]